MKSFLKGLLFGSIVGGIATLVNAPRSGKETRAYYTEQLEDTQMLSERIKQDVASIKAQIQNLKTTAPEQIEAVTNDIEKDIADFQFQAAPRIQQIQAKIDEINQQLQPFLQAEDDHHGTAE